MPRLNAHKAHRLCRSRPDERIGVALHPAGDIAAGVLFADANGASAQACHAEAVVGKQVIGQLDCLLVLPLVIALAAQQAVGAGIEDDRAFRPVKTELVIGGGVLGVERHIERRVEADAEAQLLGAGVRHLQGMVHGLALQTEGAGKHKIIRKTLCLDGIVRPQFQLDGVSLRPQQGVLQIPGKAVLAAGIKRVVIGLYDPTPKAAGGAERLRAAGVEVIGPVCEQECRDQVADFLAWQQGRPYVILKMAATMDGRIATRTGHSRWVSSEGSRALVHRLRAGIGRAGGAVLVGGGTFRADNPCLTARIPGETVERQPLACVLTSRLPNPAGDIHLLKERPHQAVFLCSPAAAASTAAHALRQMGVRVLALGPGQRGCPDFPAMFHMLYEELHCPYVLCEGGGHLALSLLEAGFADEFLLHLAPRILGDNEAAPLFDGRSPLTMAEALDLRVCRTTLCDGDVHLQLRPAIPQE